MQIEGRGALGKAKVLTAATLISFNENRSESQMV